MIDTARGAQDENEEALSRMIPERLRDACSNDTCLRICLCVCVNFVSFLRGGVCTCDSVCVLSMITQRLHDGRRKDMCLRMC